MMAMGVNTCKSVRQQPVDAEAQRIETETPEVRFIGRLIASLLIWLAF